MADSLGSLRYVAPFRPATVGAFAPSDLEKLLSIALSRGGDFADLFFEYRAGGSLGLDESILKSASRGVSIGVGVRVRRGDATGFAFVESLEFEHLREAALTAAAIANGGQSNVSHLVARTIPNRYPVFPVSLDASGSEKRAILDRVDAAARAADPRVIRVETSLNEEVREIFVATSDGRLAHDIQPLFRFGVRVIVEQNGRRQEGSSAGGGRTSLGYFEEKSPEFHAKEAVRQALVMLDAHDAPAGPMTVVLAPGDSGILLHEAVGHGLEADFNRKGTSNYTGKIGQTVASSLCSVVDDPTIALSRGSINVDDEGQEPRPTLLIEKGQLASYMHDSHSAKHFSVDPTGNGRRESYAATTIPRMTNTILQAGQDAPEDILASVSKGVYARKFGGGQVDIANGDFVFSLTESYLIENGKITAPLRGVNLIGNGPEILRRVSMLGHDVQLSDGMWTCGKDGQSVPVGVGCPTIKIDEITVGGTKI